MVTPISSSTTPSLFNWNTVVTTFKEIADNPLVKRVTENWQVAVMLSGVVFAVIGAVAAIFAGSAFLALSFLVLGGISALGAFYMHQFVILKGLEKTAEELTLERERLTLATQALQQENNVLIQTNQNLVNTNAALEETTGQLQRETAALNGHNETLKNTNTHLETTCTELQGANENLKMQMAELTTQIGQLQASSLHIRDQIVLFQGSNQQFGGHLSHLNESVKNIESQITSSKRLFDEITTQFNDGEQALGAQVQKLGEYFRELSNQNAVGQRIEELRALREQFDQTKEQLTQIQLQCTQESASLTEIQDVLIQMRDAFQSQLKDINSANTEHQAQNLQLSVNVDKLTQLLARIPTNWAEQIRIRQREIIAT